MTRVCFFLYFIKQKKPLTNSNHELQSRIPLTNSTRIPLTNSTRIPLINSRYSRYSTYSTYSTALATNALNLLYQPTQPSICIYIYIYNICRSVLMIKHWERKQSAYAYYWFTSDLALEEKVPFEGIKGPLPTCTTLLFLGPRARENQAPQVCLAIDATDRQTD